MMAPITPNEAETLRLVLHYSVPGLAVFLAGTLGPWLVALALVLRPRGPKT